MSSASSVLRDPTMQRQLLAMKQQQEFQANVAKFTEHCWDRCDVKATAKMEAKTSRCIANCVERYLDASSRLSADLPNLLSRMADSRQQAPPSSAKTIWG
ncbi:hypothetical protein BOX15_Mlig021731g2 [Macrostomum lignano]|uniref:Mitochondrial import inner membrane translocase subunit n=3 Tax=Macrostomum lignano TaxID=282301 RepID=A0A267F034_9PLAT|nr:hypothetical protein BOX15_Mlig021731g2 [Macrostomum lignano]